MLLQIFVSHLIWKPPPACLAHSSPDELLLGKSEGPPRKNRGHNQEQTFSRGRSDVLKHLSSSQTVVNHSCWMWCVCQHSIPNISGFRELRILTILRLFATTSFYLSKADSLLSLFCPCVVVGSVVPTGGFVVADKLPRSRTTWVACNTEKDSDEDAQFKYRRLKSLRRLDCVTNETGLLNCFA